MRELVEIGRCLGCDRMQRLDAGVCRACLESPLRGRAWAEMSHRCRTDAAFAQQVYDRIASARGRALFAFMHGDPRRRAGTPGN